MVDQEGIEPSTFRSLEPDALPRFCQANDVPLIYWPKKKQIYAL